MCNSVSSEVAAVIGEDAFTNLCAAFGGIGLYIAQTDACLSRLSAVIGEEAAQKLINAFHKQKIEFPKGQRGKIKLRNQSIGKDYAAKMPMRELALKYGLTERHIRNVLDSPNR